MISYPRPIHFVGMYIVQYYYWLYVFNLETIILKKKIPMFYNLASTRFLFPYSPLNFYI